MSKTGISSETSKVEDHVAREILTTLNKAQQQVLDTLAKRNLIIARMLKFAAEHKDAYLRWHPETNDLRIVYFRARE